MITAEDRNADFLKEIVNRIYAAMIRTEYMVYEMYPQIKLACHKSYTSSTLKNYASYIRIWEPKCREHAICKNNEPYLSLVSVAN